MLLVSAGNVRFCANAETQVNKANANSTENFVVIQPTPNSSM
ncbi:protein of unknown function (plasmid) [Paraburkholderia dioscoreae]|uniref:Uncharacterized protein n=1 Tax=Paraburkholderia dioscoreae TaxID=2604047 RepID=A0A5Q4Z9M5_9BURK|nr:protein of unknown function [Paraburkholderia dioscoreae]